LATKAAVSAKSSISAMKSVSLNSAGAEGPSFCKLKKCNSGKSKNGASRSGVIERRRSVADAAGRFLRGLPAHASPMRTPEFFIAARRVRQDLTCAGSACR
jgi:hypothetical protein